MQRKTRLRGWASEVGAFGSSNHATAFEHRVFIFKAKQRTQEVPRKLKERMLQTFSSTKSGSCETSAESLADH